VVGGGVGAGTASLVGGGNGGTTSSAGLSVNSHPAPAPKADGSVAAAAARISPSVVTINVVTARERDTGSGVIIRPDGYILTNNHVISAASGGGTIGVLLADGRQATAKVIGTDPSDDLAVIKVPLDNLNAATFADSSGLVAGQTVVAVGAPLGLSDTVTAGIVSNTARPVQTGDSSGNQAAVFNAIQTDAAINPGNSGGPLVDLDGDVVGINSAIATEPSSGGLLPGQSSQSGNIGIGFAIPSNEARRIAAQLITSGKATHAQMGVSVRDAATGASSLTGALVMDVTAASPAAKAGLKAGDRVTRLDSQRIDDANALVAAVRSHAPGDTVKVTYVRDGDTHQTSVTLGTSPD
jgi:putative serine protease PepD